jgi:signal transduction histidine kinase
MGVHIHNRNPKRQPVLEDNIFSRWTQTLDEHDQDVCMAMCIEVLKEHQGRIWTEEGDTEGESMYIALPVISSPTE